MKTKDNFLENTPEALHNVLLKIEKLPKRYWISQINDGDGVCMRVKIGRGMFDELRVHSPHAAKSYLVSAYKQIQNAGKGGILEIILIEDNWTGENIGVIELF